MTSLSLDLNRRRFLATAMAGAALAGAPRAFAAPNSDIRYGISGQMWSGGAPGYSNIEEGIKETARLGLDGIEPFRQHVTKYLANPGAFKAQLDAAKIGMVSCSNGGGMTTDFINPDKSAATIADHVSFARDFIKPCGAGVFKINMGQRPKDGTVSDAQLKNMANVMNEIGRQTIAFGVKLAPHPHLWGPMERENEVRAVMDATNPSWVFMTPDTGHLTLCGMDPMKIMTDYYSRIAEVHYKDCDAKYRGNKASPTPEEHAKSSLYLNMGAGGVDFPAIHAMLLRRGYKGWISLDFDAPRTGDGTGTLEDNIQANKKYLVEVLKVTTLGPPKLGQSACVEQCLPPAKAP